jgi:hypothetical protein
MRIKSLLEKSNFMEKGLQLQGPFERLETRKNNHRQNRYLLRNVNRCIDTFPLIASDSLSRHLRG